MCKTSVPNAEQGEDSLVVAGKRHGSGEASTWINLLSVCDSGSAREKSSVEK